MTEPWRYCASCGSALPAADARFCPACGSPTQDPPSPPQRGYGRLAAVLVAVLALLLAVGGGLALLLRDDDRRTTLAASASPSPSPSPTASPAVSASPSTSPSASTPSSSSAAELARRLGPGVLRVEVEGCGQEGSGTGFAIDPHHVVTNHHVVSMDPTPELVSRSGARWQGRVIGWRSSPDVAVVEVTEALPVWLPWADTASLTEGQTLVALGYPVPDLAFSVTQADIVSFQTTNGVRRAVRTDGALDRGNSGGPALTSQGRVAGVVTEMEANESGLQLVALLYTADALADHVDAILDSPGSVEPACDAGPEVLPEEWADDYEGAPAPAQPYANGDDPTMDRLQDDCASGDLSACDELYATSPFDSAYEAYGATCGERSEWRAGTCAEQPAPEPEQQEVEPAPEPQPVEPEPAPEPDVSPVAADAVDVSGTSVDGLRSACAAGDDTSCDSLYVESPAGSDDERFAATCGGRADAQPGTCTGRAGSATS